MRKDRLLKLAKFLEELPEENWDFQAIIQEWNGSCPSVACAIGWMPKVFPRSHIKWVRDVTGLQVEYKGRLDFEAAQIFFDISKDNACRLFDPFHWRSRYVKAHVVAEKIRHLVKTGECISG